MAIPKHAQTSTRDVTRDERRYREFSVVRGQVTESPWGSGIANGTVGRKFQDPKLEASILGGRFEQMDDDRWAGGLVILDATVRVGGYCSDGRM
jgi:hypothetical protein